MSDHLDKENILAELQDAYEVMGDANVREKLASDIDDCERTARRGLRVEDPYYEQRDIFQKAQDSLQQGESELQLIEEDLTSFRLLAEKERMDIQDSFWKKRIQELHDSYEAVAIKMVDAVKDEGIKTKSSEQEKVALVQDIDENKTSAAVLTKLAQEQKTIRTLLQERWGKMLDESQTQWQLNFITEIRRQIWERLREWLNLLQQLTDALRDFDFEPGLLFDLARDNLSLSDIAEMKKWAKYLSEDAEMRQLCDLLGRMRRAEQSKRREWIDSVEKFSEIRPDIHSREEYSGVKLGNSIEHALPQEKALLADAETAVLFDIKFVEGRLMEFDTIGWVQHESERTVQQETEVTEDDKKGPLIVCVDTSGSMQGMPETIAKAVALYLATAARQQKRDCFLINFSTSIETLDLSQQGTLQGLIKFLQKSFSGGTDIMPALKHAVEKMQTESYKKADLLVVSDFVMATLPPEISPLITSAKENGNRFFSLTIGDFAGEETVKDLFDCEWHYKPGDGVRQLVDIAAEAGGNSYK